jgi:hypothetical protein
MRQQILTGHFYHFLAVLATDNYGPYLSVVQSVNFFLAHFFKAGPPISSGQYFFKD